MSRDFSLELLVDEKSPRSWNARIVLSDTKVAIAKVAGCLTKETAITQVVTYCIEKHSDHIYEIVEMMYRYLEMQVTYSRISDESEEDGEKQEDST